MRLIAAAILGGLGTVHSSAKLPAAEVATPAVSLTAIRQRLFLDTISRVGFPSGGAPGRTSAHGGWIEDSTPADSPAPSAGSSGALDSLESYLSSLWSRAYGTVNSWTAGLPADQVHAVVVIKGDCGEGTGFLAHTPSGPVVITNLHVISANPNLKILADTGEEIQTVSLQGAMDRDLAMFSIRDNHYSYFDLDPDVQSNVSIGDAVIIPGNSEGGEVVVNTKGDVVGLGPEKVEFSNPIYHGNSGSPVFDPKTGQVIAVAAPATPMKPTNAVDAASFANANSAIGAMRYFGVRVDTVSGWQVYNEAEFESQTLFLKAFHEKTRALDSILNGLRNEKLHLTGRSDEDGPPDGHYYMRDPKLRAIHSTVVAWLQGRDPSLDVYAIQDDCWELQTQAREGVDGIENPGNFYAFNQIRAKEEAAYRAAMINELNAVTERLSHLHVRSKHDFPAGL